jgi:hypothetical protein
LTCQVWARGLGQGILESWPLARGAYASERILGSKRHSAKGKGQRVKNSYAMRHALCALLIFIPSARQELKPQKYPLFSITYRIYDTLKQRVMANKALLVAADKAAFQLVRL